MSATPGLTRIEQITIGGKTFVSGLWWKTLSSPRTYMSEAKQIGRDENMEMVTIRRGPEILQAGFAPKGGTKFKGMYSLAASLAGQLGPTWIGAFKVAEDRYALIAVHNGGVMPSCDFIGDFDEVSAKLHQQYSLLHAEHGRAVATYAPREFEFADDDLDLAEVLAPKRLKREYRLRPLTFGLTARELVFVSVFVAVIIAGAIGTKWYLNQQKNAAANAAARAAAAAAANAAALAKANIVRPWTTAPSVTLLIEACTQHMQTVPLSVAGWIFDSSQCGPGKATAIYRREETTPVSAFVAAATGVTGVAPSIRPGAEGGMQGALEWHANLTPTVGDTLRPTASVLTSVTSHFQALGELATATVTEKPYQANPERPDDPVPDWTVTALEITTQIPPAQLFGDLDTTGIRIFEVNTSLDSENAELTWTLKGEIYGR